MTDKITVRTKFMPGKEIEVSPEEFTDLSRQDLIYEGNATTAAGAQRAVERQQAAPAGTTSGRPRRPARKKATAKATTPPADSTTGTPAATAPTPQES